MTDERTIEWVGNSGTKYPYTIYPIGTIFTKASSNYVFAKETKPETFITIYIGETGDLSERFDDHHKMPCIKSNGATHITIHVGETSDTVRKAEEKDLRDNYDPVCNG